MNLKQRAIEGTKWTAISAVTLIIVQFLQLVVLSKLLKPSDFGLMAMVMVAIGFAESFSDMGISNSIISNKNITRYQLSTLYWINIFIALIIVLILWILAPLIAYIYGEPRVKDLVLLLAFVFPIISLGLQFQVLAQKELKFNWLAKIEISGALVGFFMSVICALNGLGVIALVWGYLVSVLFKTIIISIVGFVKWRPNFYFSISQVKEHLIYGLYQMGERSMNYISSNIDYILIGSFFGAKALGYYTLAFNLSIVPITKISPFITRVAFPIFTKVVTDLERLRPGYFKVLEFISFINFPLLFGMIATAPYAIPLIFGKQWIPSVLLVQVLAIGGLARCIVNPTNSLLLAKGRADLGFKWNCFILLTLTPAIYLGGSWLGVFGVAIVYTVFQIIYFSLNYLIIIRTLLGKCFKKYINSLWTALWMSGIMALVVWVSGLLIHIIYPWYVFYFQVILGLLLYLLLVIMFKREYFNELISFIVKRNNQNYACKKEEIKEIVSN